MAFAVDGRSDRANVRHEHDISQVRGPGAREVIMRKAEDRVVAPVVAGTGVPTLVAGIGTNLHHPEGNAGPGIGVTVGVGAHERLGRIEHAALAGRATERRERIGPITRAAVVAQVMLGNERIGSSLDE